MAKMLFCKNCESSAFTKQYELEMNSTTESVKTTWTLYKCKECNLLKLVTEESSITTTDK